MRSIAETAWARRPFGLRVPRPEPGSTWLGAIGLALALVYSIAIVSTNGEPIVLVPLVATLVVLVVVVYPPAGVFMLFGAAVLFEQYAIPGLSPLTASTRFFQNISSYTPLPLRLCMAELLMLLTFASWIARVAAKTYPRPRGGPLGWAVAGYGFVFVLGAAIGVLRGGAWNLDASLEEFRGPVYLCVLYFLAANLIRDRAQLTAVVWAFVVLVGVKGVQAVLNAQDAASLAYNLESVTGHEDVIFFDVALVMALAMVMLGIRTRLSVVLFVLAPIILAAELLTERRVGFIALGVGFAIVGLMSLARNPRRALALGLIGTFATAAYFAAFWDSSGPLAEPIRAVRSVVDSSSVSARDELSNAWRDIEDRNISFTISELPLTGVGVGQQYLFRQEPPRLLGFTYWRYMTHNALLWLWLKAGPLGGFALWFLVARVVLLGSVLHRRAHGSLRWATVVPVAAIAGQVIFSSVELGLTYSRTMIVLGTLLGLGVVIGQLVAPRGGAAAQGRGG